MNKQFFLSAAVAASLFAGSTAQAQSWQLDKSHSKLGFNVTHLMVSEVDGYFKAYDAKFSNSGNDFTKANVELTADVASVNTENEKRDEHLKGPDFFDAAKYPKITFKSTGFKKVSGDNYKVMGELTMHGVTKMVTLDAICKMAVSPFTKKPVAGLRIKGKLKRADFKLSPDTPDAMVSDEILINAGGEFLQS
jgi:polyisoprenoid-binding protein YceI